VEVDPLKNMFFSHSLEQQGRDEHDRGVSLPLEMLAEPCLSARSNILSGRDSNMSTVQMLLLGASQQTTPAVPSSEIQRQLNEPSSVKTENKFEHADRRTSTAMAALDQALSENKNVADFVEVKYNTEVEIGKMFSAGGQ
jgi:hypothetical protein